MEVQGNMILNKMTISKFHGIPWNEVIFHLAAPEFHGIPWNIPWNSMEHLCHLKWHPPNSMESLGTRWFFYLAPPEFHGIPWNIPWKSRVTWYWIKWQSQSSMEFHGTKWYFIWRHRSSMEFHGIFHGIPMELSYISFGGSRVPCNSMEYSMEFHGTLLSFEMPPS